MSRGCSAIESIGSPSISLAPRASTTKPRDTYGGYISSVFRNWPLVRMRGGGMIDVDVVVRVWGLSGSKVGRWVVGVVRGKKEQLLFSY